MSEPSERLRVVMDGYASFLRERQLAPAKHQPYLVRWVREFLLFAGEHGGYTFEQTLDMFLAEVGGRAKVKAWQIQQAADAVRIYWYQYRDAGEAAEGAGDAAGVKAFLTRLAMVEKVSASTQNQAFRALLLLFR